MNGFKFFNSSFSASNALNLNCSFSIDNFISSYESYISSKYILNEYGEIVPKKKVKIGKNLISEYFSEIKSRILIF